MTDPLPEADRALIAPYVTNLDDGVFALRNLPEEVIAVLFAYYSRSRDDLRQNLLKLLREGDLELAGGAAPSLDGDDALAAARAKARQFHEKWVVGYGHGSVAEHGCVHLALENVSIIASKLIEDARLASYTEKSTRYVAFDPSRLYTPPEIASAPAASAVYRDATTALLNAYTGWTEDVVAKVKARVTKTEKQTERGYDTACRATTFDILRYLLPSAVRTNIGLTVNARSLQGLITKLLSQPLTEGRDLGARIKAEAQHIVPTLLKYADHNPYRDETAAAFEKLMSEIEGLRPPDPQTRKRVPRGVEHKNADGSEASESTVAISCSAPPGWGSGGSSTSGARLISCEPDADDRLVASMLYGHSTRPFEELLGIARGLDRERKEAIVDEYLNRRGKHDAPGRELERIFCTVEMVMDYGAYRDVQRHRMATQTLQPLTPSLGYEMPQEIALFGYEDAYRDLIEGAFSAYERIAAAGFPHEASYVLPLATRVRVLFTWNLREVFHFVELRSARQGHPSYRKIAQDVYRVVAEAYPLIARYMRPNMNSYELTRD
jgi:thymidylate synthase ThyX